MACSPPCAAQRWPLVVALSRFGTFSDVGSTHSAADDVYPNTASLSFHGSTYTSKYLSFTGVEMTTNKAVSGQYEPLDALSAADQMTFDTYNRPPYVPGQAGAIPFIDIAGRYVSVGASYSPELLDGLTHAEIAAALEDADSDLAQAIDGAANLYTAAICQATGQQPRAVCTSPGVTAAAAQLRHQPTS